MDIPYVIESEPQLRAGEAGKADHPFRLLVDHLAGFGHQRFFSIAGPGDWEAARIRDLVYRERVGLLGLEHVGGAAGDWSAESGYVAMDSFDRSATAIVVANDLMALGALYWLQERGIRVPQDVSVVGYDGLPEGRFYIPPLTTVAADFLTLGRRISQQLLATLEPGSPPPVEAHAKLVVRASTAQPRALI